MVTVVVPGLLVGPNEKPGEPRYRLLVRRPGQLPVQCCQHDHPTPEEAARCSSAQATAQSVAGVRYGGDDE